MWSPGAGTVTVTAPRVNDKRVNPETNERQRFSSRILPAWSRKSPKVAEVLPFRAAVGAVPGLGGRIVRGHRDPADHAVAERRENLWEPGPVAGAGWSPKAKFTGLRRHARRNQLLLTTSPKHW